MLPPRTPSRIGPYRVEAVVGSGGVGTVLRAQDERTGRPVAIKLLLRGRQATPAQRQRFEREARVLRRLGHPGIVAVLDAGEHEGCPYLVMELVEGTSLQARLDRDGPLEPREAARLARDVGAALEHAHRAHVVHRDVKPDNVLLGADGRPRLTDFGLARDLDPEASRGLSASGVFLGTPGYWPPEQARGDLSRIGPASDVYALGATLYALLVGAPPFEGESLIEHLNGTLSVPPTPPSRLRAGLDGRLDAIVLRCLAKAPEERPASAGAVVQDLDAWLLATRPRRGRRRPGARPGAGLLVAGAAALAVASVVLLRARGASPPPPATAVASPVSGASALASPSTTAPTSTVTPTAVDPLAALADRAEALVRSRSPGAAAPLIEELLARRPGDARGLALRSSVRASAGDLAGALADAELMVSRRPDDPESFVVRGTVRYQLGDLGGSAADYREATRLAPAHRVAWRDLGLTLKAEGDLEGARAAFDRALALAPADATLLVDRAEVLVELRQVEAGLSDLDGALRIAPGDARALATRGTARFVRHDDVGALADLDAALRVDPEYGFALRARSGVRLALHDAQGARQDAERAVALAPSDPRALAARAAVRHGLGDFAGAAADLTLVAERLGTAAAWRAVGPDLESAGDRPGAVAAYGRALALDPRDAIALHHRGGVRLQEEDLEGARQDLAAALAITPDDVECLVRAAMIDLSLHRKADAWARLERAVQLDPRHARAWTWHGAARGPSDAAGTVADCDRALALAPGDAVALVTRAEARLALGEVEAALRDAEAGLARAAPGSGAEQTGRALVAECRQRLGR